MVFQRFGSRIVVPNGPLRALKPAQFRTDTPVVQRLVSGFSRRADYYISLVPANRPCWPPRALLARWRALREAPPAGVRNGVTIDEASADDLPEKHKLYRLAINAGRCPGLSIRAL